MTIVKTLNCNSCGGSINEKDKCDYCGKRQVITKVKEQETKTGSVLETLTFEVCKKNGVVVFSPSSLNVSAKAHLLRIRASKAIGINSVMYNKMIFLIQQCPFQMQITVTDVPLCGINISDINNFNF